MFVLDEEKCGYWVGVGQSSKIDVIVNVTVMGEL